MPNLRIFLVIVIGVAGIVALWLLGAVLMSNFLRGGPVQDADRLKEKASREEPCGGFGCSRSRMARAQTLTT
jgi:hypothetical protein